MKFKFKEFQLHDFSAAAMAQGLVLAHDTGLGKSLAAVTWPLLKCGFDKVGGEIKVRGPVLLIAPGDLHDQLRAEFKKFYGIVPTSINDQAGLLRLMVNRTMPDSTSRPIHGWRSMVFRKSARWQNSARIPPSRRYGWTSLISDGSTSAVE